MANRTNTMNKEEAKIKLEELKEKVKELETIIAKQQFNPKKFLIDIFSDFNYKVDRKKYPDVKFFGFDKEGNYLFDYDEKTNTFWMSYKRIWEVLEKETSWNYDQIQDFTKVTVEDHFKLKVVTTKSWSVSS